VYELDFIFDRGYHIGMWAIDATEEYLAWFEQQEEQAKEKLLMAVRLLEEFGPTLGRPHADTLKGSDYKNLKELRAKTPKSVLRVAYIFDEKRKALILIGGDKKGKKEAAFYKRLIADAEELIKRYLK
jgi:hypothetical protein